MVPDSRHNIASPLCTRDKSDVKMSIQLWWNDSDGGKLGEYLVQCQSVINMTSTSLGSTPGLRADRQATNRLRSTCRIKQPPSNIGNFDDGLVRREVYATGATVICSSGIYAAYAVQDREERLA